MTTKMRKIAEKAREITLARADKDEPLNFYPVARELGADEDEAEAIDQYLVTRLMIARGAL